MVEMTIQGPTELEERVKHLGPWLSTVLEIGLAGFKAAGDTTAEVIRFLADGPSDEQVMAFHVSQRGQQDLQRLLTLNEKGLLGPEEKTKLDELLCIERILVKLKATISTRRSNGPCD